MMPAKYGTNSCCTMSDVRRVMRGVVLPRCTGTRTLMMGSAFDAVDCGACALENVASKDMRGSPIRASSCISTSWHRERSVMLLKGPHPPGRSDGAKICSGAAKKKKERRQREPNNTLPDEHLNGARRPSGEKRSDCLLLEGLYLLVGPSASQALRIVSCREEHYLGRMMTTPSPRWRRSSILRCAAATSTTISLRPVCWMASRYAR